MELRSLLPSWLTLTSGILVLTVTAVLLATNRKQREVLFGRLNIRQRRTSGSETPPRSLSPDKKSNDSEYAASPPGLVDAFPPSRRDALPELAAHGRNGTSEILPEAASDKDFLKEHALPTTRSYELDNQCPKYTPTGFSTAEIKALGDFPRYDVLSGVPLPKPYEAFHFEKALPRPYRPLRWAYHQTMCKNIFTLTE